MKQLNIPKKLHVGFQNRSDTYDGKLAYIIYTDEKNKKRKENSWNGWRDDTIPPLNIDNEPLDGFVLNKGVGGVRGSWGRNTRNEYIRIYDPRGFEFEISIYNLLFILQHCNAYKGKGLEGKFVYAWEGTEIILLPIDCQEYKDSLNFTSLKSLKVTKKDMVDGCRYLHKDETELTYLGRLDCKLNNYWYDTYDNLMSNEMVKRHIFIDDKGTYYFEKGFTKLAKKINDELDPEYADKYTKFKESKYVSRLQCLEFKEIEDITAIKDLYYSSYIIIEYEGIKYNCRLNTYGYDKNIKSTLKNSNSMFIGDISKINIDHQQKINVNIKNLYELTGVKFFTPYFKLESGKLIKVQYYVK